MEPEEPVEPEEAIEHEEAVEPEEAAAAAEAEEAAAASKRRGRKATKASANVAAEPEKATASTAAADEITAAAEDRQPTKSVGRIASRRTVCAVQARYCHIQNCKNGMSSHNAAHDSMAVRQSQLGCLDTASDEGISL